MLRMLGSSLVAKNSPGSKFRELGEKAMQTPLIPGKGAIGTLTRESIEEPLERPVPPGSEKVVATKPLLEFGVTEPIYPTTPTAVREGMEAMPPAGQVIRPALGLSTSPGNVPQGSQSQALLQGMPSQAPVAPAIRATQAKSASYQSFSTPSTEATKISKPQVITPLRSSPSSEVQLRSQPSVNYVPAQNPITKFLGARAYAGETPTSQLKVFTPTTGQYLAGVAGKVLSSVPQLRSISNQLQSFGGQPNITIGSVSNVLRSITNMLSNALGLRSFGFR